jgi:Fic family protein
VNKEQPFDTVMRVLQDPAFARAARDAIRDYVARDELEGYPGPEMLTTAQLWDVLSTVRKLAATTIPIAVASGEQVWYTITVEGRHCLRAIEHHCRSDSRLHQMVQRRSGQRFLVNAQVQEAIATCQVDGIEGSSREFERMLHQGRTPTTPEERIVKNTYEMLGELPALVDEDFSPELVRHLFERTTHGVNLAETPRIRTELRGVPPVFQGLVKAHRPSRLDSDPMQTDESASEALRQICDYANGETGDPRESIAVRGYMLMAAVGYWRPVPDFNGTVARHMLRLLSAKHDFPVLGYLPTSVMTRRWALGEMDADAVRYSRIESGRYAAGGIDATAEILIHLQLTVAAINDLCGRIRSTKVEDETLGRMLHTSERLNYRQRDLLSHALRRPDAEFTLREHRLDHRTAYSTARADLLELVELGFLCQETRGLAFVFTPSPNLRERLSAAAGETAEPTSGEHDATEGACV